MNILFVHNSRDASAPWTDGSTRYRCYHLAESLRNLGYRVDITSLSEAQLNCLSRYGIVIVQRPRSSKALKHLIKRCNLLGIRTVADVDDLVFVPKFAHISPSVINSQATESSITTRFQQNLFAMLRFDEITVSTEPLAKHWRDQTGTDNVSVVPNGLSNRWLQTSVDNAATNDEETRTITYLPGSNSHDKDFSQIADVLATVLRERSDARLLIVGTLNTDETKFPRNRIARCQWVDYSRLPQIIAYSSVTLAPLVPSPFTYAKSHIKFIESAAFGTPVICSPNHDICRHKSDGLLLASSEQDWYSALKNILDEPLGVSSLQIMKSYVRNNATANQSANVLKSHWLDSGLDRTVRAA